MFNIILVKMCLVNTFASMTPFPSVDMAQMLQRWAGDEYAAPLPFFAINEQP